MGARPTHYPYRGAHVAEGFIAPWLKGFNGFMSGVLPPEPGFYGTRYYHFLSGAAGSAQRLCRIRDQF